MTEWRPCYAGCSAQAVCSGYSTALCIQHGVAFGAKNCRSGNLQTVLNASVWASARQIQRTSRTNCTRRCGAGPATHAPSQPSGGSGELQGCPPRPPASSAAASAPPHRAPLCHAASGRHASDAAAAPPRSLLRCARELWLRRPARERMGEEQTEEGRSRPRMGGAAAREGREGGLRPPAVLRAPARRATRVERSCCRREVGRAGGGLRWHGSQAGRGVSRGGGSPRGRAGRRGGGARRPRRRSITGSRHGGFGRRRRGSPRRSVLVPSSSTWEFGGI